MAVRTIDAPGIETHEIDKSQYSPSMSGTKALVTGFASSGEDYVPMIFTSKSAWLNYYGEPTNEAERYFYAASMEVINQNGVVNCCKLPYENESRDKFVGQKYKLAATNVFESKTVADLLGSTKYSVLKEIISTSDSYNRDVLRFFAESVNITDATDKRAVMDKATSGVNLKFDEVLGQLVNQNDDPENLRTDGKTETEVQGETFYALYGGDDLGTKDKLGEAFIGQMTKGDLMRYLDELKTIEGIMPRLNVYWHIESQENEILSSAQKIKDVVSVTPFLGSMAKATAEVAELLSVDSKQFPAASSFRTDNYQTKTVSQMCDAILDVAGVALGGKLPVKDPKTVADYYATLSNAIEVGQYGVTVQSGGLKQDISVMMAYDEDIDTVVLTATNEFSLPNGSDDFRIDSITDLLYSAYPTYKDDDTADVGKGFFATFDSEDGVYGVTYKENNKLVLRLVNGYDAFQLVANSDSFNSSADAKNRVRQILRDGNFDLVQSTNGLKDADEYFKGRKAAADELKEGQIKAIRNELILSEVKLADQTVDRYWKVESKGTPALYDMSVIDEYRTDESRVGTNEILIVDKTRKAYAKVPEDKTHKNDGRELIGIVPVVTTAANALYAQSMIDVDDSCVTDFEAIRDLNTLDCSKNAYQFLGNDVFTHNVVQEGQLSSVAVLARRLNNVHTEEDSADDFFDSLALEANTYFPSISLQADGSFDRENMKKVGIVVYKAYLDASEGNRISFQCVESFVGSLDRTERNPNTGAEVFIDKVVNENSEYINVFSNCIPTDDLRKKYNEEIDILVVPHDKADIASLGFYEGMCERDIDVSESILKALDVAYDKVTDINERDIDIVVDGGVSNIAQFVKTVYGKKGAYDPASPDAAVWKCKKDGDVKMWKTVIQKYDNFCKNVRKDCMFIADGPRPLGLQGQKKIVRPSKPTNTIDANILPFVKYLTGINTSYGAGYCDWFQVADEFSGDYFWCPPSIKACGIYIYTDLNANYWDAPAGLNRGLVSALDVAFSPTNKQAGQIYTKSWNYAINYPSDGIVLEGQRTLQTKPSALDRVNVRRLMLRLERATYNILRYVVYEGNTAYMRQRVVDLIDPYFKQAKIGGGVYDYKIVCDESNNTSTTIDNNELHINIGIKPTKTIEFIIVNFTILSTGASWDEM